MSDYNILKLSRWICFFIIQFSIVIAWLSTNQSIEELFAGLALASLISCTILVFGVKDKSVNKDAQRLRS